MIEDEAGVIQKLGNNADETIGTFQSIIEGNSITLEQAQEIAENENAAQAFQQTYGGDTTAEGILATANIAAKKNAATYGGVALTEKGERLVSSEDVANRASNAAAGEFRDASYVGKDYKTQTFSTKQGSVTVELKRGDTRFISGYGKAAITVARAVANITGANIKIVDSFAEKNTDKARAETPNGFYDPNTNTIEIALDSQNNVAYVISHELTHWLQNNVSQEAYDTYKNVVENTINNIDIEHSQFDSDVKEWIQEAQQANPDVKLFDALVQFEMDKYNGSDQSKAVGNTISREAAIDEVLAEVGETMLGDETVQREVCEQNMEAAKGIQKFFNKILEGLNNLFNIKQREVVEGKEKNKNINMTSRETDILRSSQADVEKIAKQWAAMIKEVQKNGPRDVAGAEGTGTADVKNSTRHARANTLMELYSKGKATAEQIAELDKLNTELAAQAGFPLRLARGTMTFGATDFNSNRIKGEEGQTWASSSPAVANSYSGRIGYEDPEQIQNRKLRPVSTNAGTASRMMETDFTGAINKYLGWSGAKQITSQEALTVVKDNMNTTADNALKMADKLDSDLAEKLEKQRKARSIFDIKRYIKNTDTVTSKDATKIRELAQSFRNVANQVTAQEVSDALNTFINEMPNGLTYWDAFGGVYNLKKFRDNMPSIVDGSEAFYTNSDRSTVLSKTSAIIGIEREARGDDSNVGTYDLFANPDGLLEVECKGYIGAGVPADILGLPGQLMHSRDFVKYVKKMGGYTGVVFKNLSDPGEAMEFGPESISDVYCFFDSSQTKSADLVTYDNEGKIIPAEERFKTDRTGDEVWRNTDIRFSVRQMTNGRKFAWVSKNIFQQRRAGISEIDFVGRYLTETYGTNWLIGTNDNTGVPIYAEQAGRTPKSKYGLAEEYVKSDYTQWIRNNAKHTFRAKMEAAGVLEDLVAIAKKKGTSQTKHSNNKDAKFGVTTYKSIFAFPVYDAKGEFTHANAYDCELIVLNASDGKQYLYDIVEIKKNTASGNDISQIEAQRLHPSGINNITQPAQTVNNQNNNNQQNNNQHSVRVSEKGRTTYSVEEAPDITDVKTGYENVSDALMGFRTNGYSQSFDESKYPYTLKLWVSIDGSDFWDDEIKGMNYYHALERAKRDLVGGVFKLRERTETPTDKVASNIKKDAKRIKIETNKPVQSSVRQSKSIQQRTMDAVHALVESKKPAEEEARKYEIVGITVQKLCDIINNEYVGKLDKNGMPLLPEEGKLSNNIFSNSSYSKDAEPTTECYRQATYRALYKLVTDRLGRPLTNKEQMIVNQAAIEIGVDAPCIYCYSLLDRKAKEAYKLQYVAERDGFMQAIDNDFGGNKEAFHEQRAQVFDKYYQLYLSRVTDPSAYVDGEYDKSKARKGNDAKKTRVNLWMDLYEKYYGTDAGLLSLEQIRNVEAEGDTREQLEQQYNGEDLKLKTAELDDLQYWIQSSSQAKKIVPYSAYTNAGKSSILQWSKAVINALNAEYGLRWYSHADFHLAFTIDNIQQITDASVRGLKGLMYVKPIEAAKIFVPTGMNINVSCFGKYVNGEYVCDDRMGADWEQVKALRNQ